MQSRALERGRLREATTDIEGLHRLAGRALHQVVERGHDYNAVGVGIALEADVAPVGAGEELGFRVAMDSGGFFDEPHEGLVLVGRAVNGPDLLLGQRVVEENVRSGQDAADRLDRRGGERNLRSLPVDGQLLDDLGLLAVAGWLERAHRPTPFRMMGAKSGRATRPRGSRLGLDDHWTGEVHDFGLEERVETENAGRSHASGAGDQVGIAQLLTMQLRNAIDERSQELWVLVVVAVPLGVVGGIAQPEVGTEVDDD